MGVYALDCDHCPRQNKCDQWGVSGVQYKHEGKSILGKDWKKCPAAYLADPHLSLAVELYASTKISPLADWPDGWAAWVRDYLVKIQHSITERKNFDQER